jgi:hypothetical protein
LQGNSALLLESWRISTEDQLLRSGSEVGETSDGKVFVVEVGVLTKEIIGLDSELD